MNNKTRVPQDPKAFGKVAVLLGGTSAEREVSLKSGAAVLQALQNKGVNAHGIDAQKGVLDQLKAGNFDRVFIALHGRGGEDGTLQGALELMGLPYTGSGVMASALAMDKLRTKYIWSAVGLPTPPFRMLDANTDFQAVVAEIGVPIMVKPAHEGSSIGMSKVSSAEQLQQAYLQASQYDDNVLAEKWITGKEYTAAVLGDQVLPLIRLETPNDFYDYDAKYVLDNTGYHCPCGLDQATEQRYQAMALQAFKAVGGSGWGRVDFLCDEQGNPWLLEVNTVPGMTDHSLVPMAAKANGIEFDDLILHILASSL